MRHIAYRFRAAIRFARMKLRVGTARVGTARVGTARVGTVCVGTGAPAHPSRAKLGSCQRLQQLSTKRFSTPRFSKKRFSKKRFSTRNSLLCAALLATLPLLAPLNAPAETRPHYGGTLRVMMQSSPNALDVPGNASPTEYRDLTRTLALIGDTLVKLDAEDRPHSSLAIAWQSDSSARHWQFTLRHGLKFHDGVAVTPAAIAQILSAAHPTWSVRAATDSVSIDVDTATPSLLAELALPRSLVLKRSASGLPIGTGPFLVAQWEPGKSLKLAANEDSWSGRPFVDFVEIEFGKSLRDQAQALELAKADLIESAPQATSGTERNAASLPVELMALVFPSTSRAQDHRLREALALAIDRKPIQSVLLKGVGEPAASILPNWMTGYAAVFSSQSNPQRPRTLLAESRQPSLNLTYDPIDLSYGPVVLSYDPSDPQAQLIAERIALNAREVGITVQVSLSGPADIRLMRVLLPSPDPATSLAEAARQLAMPQPPFPATRTIALDDLYLAEKSLLEGHALIPLFHLPVASATSSRVNDWNLDRLGDWSDDGSDRSDDRRYDLTGDRTDAGSSLANVWLGDTRPEAGSR
jgi:Bacterial extracellular solute-binding proteins, family 5 Middle